ncbi:hypothetical protein HZS_3519 [Henneguya salminicola]|nr:hypothetical protein HZS_3519 [Henneguya salminicola]
MTKKLNCLSHPYYYNIAKFVNFPTSIASIQKITKNVKFY